MCIYFLDRRVELRQDTRRVTKKLAKCVKNIDKFYDDEFELMLNSPTFVARRPLPKIRRLTSVFMELKLLVVSNFLYIVDAFTMILACLLLSMHFKKKITPNCQLANSNVHVRDLLTLQRMHTD